MRKLTRSIRSTPSTASKGQFVEMASTAPRNEQFVVRADQEWDVPDSVIEAWNREVAKLRAKGKLIKLP